MTQKHNCIHLSNDPLSHQVSPLRMMLTNIRDKKKTGGNVNPGFGTDNDAVDTFWINLFTIHFNCSNESPEDDMLFFVKKMQPGNNADMNLKPEVEVYRKGSRNLPSHVDSTINWEESVYLNVIMHKFEYCITCAVCTRTGPLDLQMLNKSTQKVFASPTHRAMDTKGTGTAISYPNIYFAIDQFEETFEDMIVRDSEFVAVEVVAKEKKGSYESIIFQGSVRYESLKKTYDNRKSMTSRMMQRMSFGLYTDKRRVEFMKLRGPKGKGHAQMAVSRVKGSGSETPRVEHFPIADFENHQTGYLERRMSDPISQTGARYPGGCHHLLLMKKSRSDNEAFDAGVDKYQDTVEAGTFEDELSDGTSANGLWSWPFGQAWHYIKQHQRANSVALLVNLTYVTLPWHRIIADLLDNQGRPLLTH